MHLSQLQIPHCHKPSDFGTVIQTELHHFADGLWGLFLSKIDFDGNVCCSLVMKKSHILRRPHDSR